VRRAYAHGTVIGFLPRGGGSGGSSGSGMKLNPKESEVVPSGSQLVFVAASQSVERAEGAVEVRVGGWG